MKTIEQLNNTSNIIKAAKLLGGSYREETLGHRITLPDGNAVLLVEASKKRWELQAVWPVNKEGHTVWPCYPETDTARISINSEPEEIKFAVVKFSAKVATRWRHTESQCRRENSLQAWRAATTKGLTDLGFLLQGDHAKLGDIEVSFRHGELELKALGLTLEQVACITKVFN